MRLLDYSLKFLLLLLMISSNASAYAPHFNSNFSQQLKDSNLSDTKKKALVSLTATLTSLATNGNDAALLAGNVDKHNRQLHKSEVEKIKELARKYLLAEKAKIAGYVKDKQKNYDDWAEGGKHRVAMHARIGYLLTGSDEGAKAAALIATLAPKLEEALKHIKIKAKESNIKQYQ